MSLTSVQYLTGLLTADGTDDALQV